jgi:hypothetical protein
MIKTQNYSYVGKTDYDFEKKRSVPHSEGAMRFNNGSIFRGKWNYGSIIEGTITFSDGKQKKFENDILSDLSDEISNENKPEELKSVKIIRQKYGDCWAHSI